MLINSCFIVFTPSLNTKGLTGIHADLAPLQTLDGHKQSMYNIFNFMACYQFSLQDMLVVPISFLHDD